MVQFFAYFGFDRLFLMIFGIKRWRAHNVLEQESVDRAVSRWFHSFSSEENFEKNDSVHY